MDRVNATRVVAVFACVITLACVITMGLVAFNEVGIEPEPVKASFVEKLGGEKPPGFPPPTKTVGPMQRRLDRWAFLELLMHVSESFSGDSPDIEALVELTKRAPDSNSQKSIEKSAATVVFDKSEDVDSIEAKLVVSRHDDSEWIIEFETKSGSNTEGDIVGYQVVLSENHTIATPRVLTLDESGSTDSILVKSRAVKLAVVDSAPLNDAWRLSFEPNN